MAAKQTDEGHLPQLIRISKEAALKGFPLLTLRNRFDQPLQNLLCLKHKDGIYGVIVIYDGTNMQVGIAKYEDLDSLA